MVTAGSSAAIGLAQIARSSAALMAAREGGGSAERSRLRGVLDAAKNTSAVAINEAIITPRQTVSLELAFPRRFAGMGLSKAKQVPQRSRAF